MKTGTLICLVALLLIAQPVFAQQTIDKSCVSQAAVDMGDIGKQRLNFTQNGTLNPGEMSWFKFKVVDPARFFITILDPEASFGFIVYDEAMRYLASGRDMIALSLREGSYFVRLDARPYEKVNYTLLASNNIETEPNDGLSEANDIGPISGSLLFGGSIEPAGDTDFLKFSVPEGQGGMLRISSDSDMSLVLYGYNESKKQYLPEMSGEGRLRALVDPGSYCLRAENYGDQSSTYNYTLNVSLFPITCDKEPNDSFAQAVPMGTLNASAALTEKGCTKSGDDKDYFKFEVPGNMSVAIETITEGDSYIYLYDSEEKQLAYNDDYLGWSSRIDRDLEPGNYYVSVGGYGALEYELSVRSSQ